MSARGPARPPRFATTLLALFVPEPYRDAVLGDAAEEFDEHRRDPATTRWAALLYWRQLLRIDWVRLRLEARTERRRRTGESDMKDVLAGDLRQAFAVFRVSPGLAAAVVLTLALGIGANTAIFSIVDSLLFRQLPVEDADRLVLLTTDETWSGSAWSHPIWESVRERTALHDGGFAFRTVTLDLSETGVADPVEALQASGDIFAVLGVDAVLGRTFSEADDDESGGVDGPVAVVSHAFWQRRLEGDPGVIGRSLTLNGTSVTIVGVTPPEFFGPEVGRSFDVAVPLGLVPRLSGEAGLLENRGAWWLRVILRLAPEQSIEQATAGFRAAQPRIAEETLPLRPDDAEDYLARPFTLIPSVEGGSELKEMYREPVLALLAIVLMTLLIACGNIANLMLARSNSRRKELGVRKALGASGGRLARQLLIESAVLAGIGGALGIVCAHWGSRLILVLFSSVETQVSLDVGVDGRMLAFTGILSVGTALLFGSIPAIRAARSAPTQVMTASDKALSGGSRRGVSGSLVVAQVGLSVVLLIGTGLFVRTFQTLATADLGLEPDRVLLAHLRPGGAGLEPELRSALYTQVLDDVRGMPEVSQAALSMITPLAGSNSTRFMEFPGRPQLPEAERRVWLNVVSPGWFETLGTPLLRGRDFDERDRRDATRVLIVNRTFVERYYGEEDPIGRTIHQSVGPEGTPTLRTIVGVVEDAVYRSVREPVPPTMYWPLSQLTQYPAELSVLARSEAQSPSAIAQNVATTVSRAGPEMSIVLRTLTDELNGRLAQERMLATLASFFGALALLLSALGIYSTTAYSVSQRRTELGIRCAVGAAPVHLVRAVLNRTALLIGAGLALGLLVGSWASTLIQGLVFGLSPHDPTTWIVAALTLVAVGALAGWVPAIRAARTDPVGALRRG